MKNKLLLFASLCALTMQLVAGNIKVNPYFQSHMVLQRNQPITIWGTADQSTEVKVTLGKETQQTQADDEGKWQVTFRSKKASFTPLTLTVDSQQFSDILVGDVWICAGQSKDGDSSSRTMSYHSSPYSYLVLMIKTGHCSEKFNKK